MSSASLQYESKLEFLLAMREPAFIIPTLAFPLMFYVFFGLLFGGGGTAAYLMVTYGVFGIMGPSLFGFGANIAMDRDKGWLAIKYVSPVPPMQLLLAKLFCAIVFSSAIVVGLFFLAAAFGHVALEKIQWASLAVLFLLGTIPFCALGLAVGFWVKGSAAIAVVNLIYLPSAFLSGLWIPIHMFPEWLQKMSTALPPFHLSQLGLKVIGEDLGQNIWGHVLVLCISTVLFLVIAGLGYKRSKDD